MPTPTIQISDPVATLISAASQVVVAVLQYSSSVRSSESQESRDEEDHIRFQAYWDWRAILQVTGIVGDKMQWPPVPVTLPAHNLVQGEKPK